MAVGVAVYQAKKQQQNTMEALAEERRQDYLRTAETFHELAKNCLKLQRFIAGKLVSRDAVYTAASDGLPFDMPNLRAMEHYLDGIELHSLPASLVSLALILSSTVRQFRAKVEKAFQYHRQMDAEEYQDFFATLGKMTNSLEQTVWDFGAELKKLTGSKV
ncbi:MAG TPA: hypothetical protein VJT81_09880 [Burkholderiales bacterium]|nr:hypothetical protein [Burkholderiales bacterium]